jgi:hypothetical protein
MDAREEDHAMGFRAPYVPIDNPDHEDHDPGRKKIKGGVRTAVAGSHGVGTAVRVIMVLGLMVPLLNVRGLQRQRAVMMPMESVGHREAGFTAIAAR